MTNQELHTVYATFAQNLAREAIKLVGVPKALEICARISRGNIPDWKGELRKLGDPVISEALIIADLSPADEHRLFLSQIDSALAAYLGAKEVNISWND